MSDEQKKEYGSIKEMVEDLRRNDPEKLEKLQDAFNVTLIRSGLKPLPLGKHRKELERFIERQQRIAQAILQCSNLRSLLDVLKAEAGTIEREFKYGT